MPEHVRDIIGMHVSHLTADHAPHNDQRDILRCVIIVNFFASVRAINFSHFASSKINPEVPQKL
jgi:hypothetical protein